MNEKCAIYVRVSSDIQDYDRQIKDMKRFAEESNLSFSKEHLYEDKLSGFKNEDEREGLKKLKKEVIELKIEKVLIWEISRLARKHKNLLELTEFFQKNGINIYFYIQRFWLLDDTLNVSPQAGLSIAFFGWHGEYEARLTKERFMSAKKLNESLGRYNGGKITFGYTIDKHNNYIIDDRIISDDKIVAGLNVSKSDIVREVFNLYEDGLTCSQICRICQAKGYPKKVCNTHTLARVLRDTSYIGYINTKLGKRPMPQIISQSQFNNVRKLIDANKTKADKGKKHVYLLRGVLKCSVCDEYYVGKQTDDAYICPKNSGSNKTNKNSSCEGGNISASNIDGIVWHRIKKMLLYKHSTSFDQSNKEDTVEINDMENQIVQYKDLIYKKDQGKKKANIIFQNDGYTIEEYKKAIKKINNEIKECEKAIDILESKIKYNAKMRSESRKLSRRIKNIEEITDRYQMQTIIKSLIESIYFYKITNFKRVVIIKYRDVLTEGLMYNSVQKRGTFYRTFNKNQIRFDEKGKVFYSLKDIPNSSIKARTEVLKQNGIGENLPEYIPIQEFYRLSRINKLKNIDESRYVEPYPNESNSNIYDFDTLMTIKDIPHILSTNSFNKITYFKDLNKERFYRRNKKKRRGN